MQEVFDPLDHALVFITPIPGDQDLILEDARLTVLTGTCSNLRVVHPEMTDHAVVGSPSREVRITDRLRCLQIKELLVIGIPESDLRRTPNASSYHSGPSEVHEINDQGRIDQAISAGISEKRIRRAVDQLLQRLMTGSDTSESSDEGSGRTDLTVVEAGG